LYATVRPGFYPILGSTFYHRRRYSSACISANIRRLCLSTFASRSTTSVTSSLQTFQAFSAALRLLFRSFTHRFLQAHHHPRRIIRSRLVDHENPSSLPTTLVLIPSRDSHARQDISTITALLHYRHPAPVRTALPAHLSTAEHHRTPPSSTPTRSHLVSYNNLSDLLSNSRRICSTVQQTGQPCYIAIHPRHHSPFCMQPDKPKFTFCLPFTSICLGSLSCFLDN